jgi:hypothetical protein
MFPRRLVGMQVAPMLLQRSKFMMRRTKLLEFVSDCGVSQSSTEFQILLPLGFYNLVLSGPFPRTQRKN